MKKSLISQVMSEMGKRSAAKMTPEQRSERARKAGSMKGKKTITLYKCTACGEPMTEKEYKDLDGACDKCWKV